MSSCATDFSIRLRGEQSILNRLLVGWLEKPGSIPDGVTKFCVLQVGSGDQLSSYPTGRRVSLRGCRVARAWTCPIIWHYMDRESWYIWVLTTHQMHFLSKFIPINILYTCFDWINCSSSGGSLLYMQSVAFIMLNIYIYMYNRYRVFLGGKAAGAWCWPPTPI